MSRNPTVAENQRRELIEKQYCQGLTEAEWIELEALQIKRSRWLDRKFPLPFEALTEAEDQAYRADPTGGPEGGD